MTRTIIAAIFLAALLASPLFAGSNTAKDYEQLRRLRVASDIYRRVWYSEVNVKAGHDFSFFKRHLRKTKKVRGKKK